jgi:hypothetical protein
MGKGFERYTGSENEVEHEAGYDAYMTGVIYLAFIAFIREKQQEESPTKENGLGKRKRSESDENDDSSEEESEEKATEMEEEDTNVTVDKIEDEDVTMKVENDKKSDSEDSEDSEEGEVSDSDSDSSDEEKEDEKEAKKKNMFMDKSITPYYGRIFLMRSDIPYINLKGEEQVGNVEVNYVFLYASSF